MNTLKKLSNVCLILLIGLSILVSSNGVFAKDTLSEEIDWDKGAIRVLGFGAPPADKPKAVQKLMAQRAAKADAYRNAVAALENIRVDSKTLVNNYLTVNDEIFTQVQGLIQNGQFISIQYDQDGMCTVVLEVPIGCSEGLASILLESIRINQDSFFPLIDRTHPKKDENFTTTVSNENTYFNEEEQVSVNSGSTTTVQPIDSNNFGSNNDSGLTNNTDLESENDSRMNNSGILPGKEVSMEGLFGIIIDARGLNIEPALYPQVFDSTGRRLYGATSTTFITSPYATMVAYCKTIDDAYSMGRAGDNPIFIKAVDSVSTDGVATDVVLDAAGVAKFLEADALYQVTARRAIIFIID